MRAEGITKLYRGLLPPLIMRTTTRSIMFGMLVAILHFSCRKEASAFSRYDKYKSLLGAVDHSGTWASVSPRHAAAAFLGVLHFTKKKFFPPIQSANSFVCAL